MARFKMNEKVIIFNNGKYEVAIICSKAIMQKRRTFNVKTETGFEIPYVPVDDTNCAVYIDSDRTKKFINKISTNLSENLKGNVK